MLALAFVRISPPDDADDSVFHRLPFNTVGALLFSLPVYWTVGYAPGKNYACLRAVTDVCCVLMTAAENFLFYFAVLLLMLLVMEAISQLLAIVFSSAMLGRFDSRSVSAVCALRPGPGLLSVLCARACPLCALLRQSTSIHAMRLRHPHCKFSSLTYTCFIRAARQLWW